MIFKKSPDDKSALTDRMLSIPDALSGTFQAIIYFCENGYAVFLIFHGQSCIKELMDALCMMPECE